MPFAEVFGHHRLISLLKRSIASGTLPPSLLFVGPAGVGKRKMAIAVAQALNCERVRGSGADGCGECAACRRIERGVHPDVPIVEPGDNGSIKIDQVRDIVERAAYRPFEGRRRVVIVDEADALVPAAQNALLKTLEEPRRSSRAAAATARRARLRRPLTAAWAARSKRAPASSSRRAMSRTECSHRRRRSPTQ